MQIKSKAATKPTTINYDHTDKYANNNHHRSKIVCSIYIYKKANIYYFYILVS